MRHPDQPWRCFHCGEVFTDQDAAREHFGSDEFKTPACIIKGSEGGLVKALRDAEREAEEAWSIIRAESAEGLRAFHRNLSRHEQAVGSAEQTGYERGLDDRRAEIERLRRIVARYGDRLRMANCHRSDWQIEIDEAMRFVADNPEPETA